MEIAIDCRGEVHCLLVNPVSRRLRLRDHNLRAELADLALGGTPCACLSAAIFLEWRSHLGYGGRVGRTVLFWLASREDTGPMERYRLSRRDLPDLPIDWRRWELAELRLED